MREAETIAVLGYLVVATFAEVFLANNLAAGLTYYVALGLIAISEAVLVGAYYMRLKYESLPLRAISFVGIMFISLLIISMILNYAKL